MKRVLLSLKYGYYVISGAIALYLVYLYDGAVRLPYFESGSGWGILRMALDFKALDVYFLFNLLVMLPIIRIYFAQVSNDKTAQFETYKDRALRLHHSDAQANHKNRDWSANGVTANPWEYMHASTQSYQGVTDWLFKLAKGFFLNLLLLLFGPLFLGYWLIKKTARSAE